MVVELVALIVWTAVCIIMGVVVGIDSERTKNEKESIETRLTQLEKEK